MVIDIDAMMERMRQEETLTCPYCGYEFERDADFPEDLITYHGEEGEVEVACPSCDEDFMAKEIVRRTYESRRMEDDPE